MNSTIMDTKINTILVERGKTIESIVEEALNLFKNNQTVICLSGQQNYSIKIKEVIKILKQEGCEILDVFEDSGHLLYFLDNPFLSYK